MSILRVMQSFGEPRPTTNPYIVMLRDALVVSPEVEHLPFSWRTALTGSFDVFHVHWADTLLAGRSRSRRAAKRAAFVLLLLRLRLGRIAVVRTVHNPGRAPEPGLDGRLSRALERRADLLIRISATTPEDPRVPSVLIPHGHYRDWFAPMPRSAAVPGRLGYVGLIKPYKGLDTLMSAYAAAVERRPDLTLRVAGRPADDGIAADIRAAEAALPGLEATLRYVDEAEFAQIVTESTLVVLPYRQMHNSGAALAALSLGRAVLVPDNETNRALAQEVGEGWVRTFRGDLSADDLIAAVEAAPGAGRGPDLSARGWADAAARYAAAYRRARDIRRGAPATSTAEEPAHG
ncbi:glycosyltransferase [Microbacterium sp.]|uniref:glycosyltransferase n=1 Tax=Microbacterium sp. TaxID=51671 RepID=UPI0025E8E715|nr:glycosyltransferase [Microbacterium sp.]